MKKSWLVKLVNIGLVIILVLAYGHIVNLNNTIDALVTQNKELRNTYDELSAEYALFNESYEN